MFKIVLFLYRVLQVLFPYCSACSQSFQLPMTVNILSQKCQFYSCMVEGMQSCTFISLCPDGSVRQFQDEKVSYSDTSYFLIISNQ